MGEVGVLQDAPLSRPATAPPPSPHLTLPSPPSLTQWLTPLFLCLFFCPSHLVLVTHSATTRCRFTGKQKKNSEEGDRISLTWEGEISRRLVKVWNSHTVSFLLSFLHSPSPFYLLPLWQLFVTSSVFSHYPLNPPPLLSPQWVTTCIVSSVTTGLISSTTHSVSVVWAWSH